MNWTAAIKQMLVDNPEMMDDAREGSQVGNSCIGSLLSLFHHVPRQYAEEYVRRAVAEIDSGGKDE